MILRTKSGAEYTVIYSNKGLMYATKPSLNGWVKCSAIWSSRIPFMNSAITWVFNNPIIEGFNEKGKRTIKVDVTKVEKGMVLASPHGFRSTEIVEILEPK